MPTFIYILLANLFISLFSLAGVFLLLDKQKVINKFLLFLVSLSTGTMLGGAFLHLLPEAESTFADKQMMYFLVLAAFGFFFITEKILHWRHCHDGKCEDHAFGYLNLIGDAIHNFIDGLIIAGVFLLDIRLGVITSVVIALHEIPQEIGDLGVLLYAGFTKKKALIANFIVALTAVLGGIIGYVVSKSNASFVESLLPFAAGGFMYIAMSDLMPEIRKEKSLKKSLLFFAVTVLGVFIMYAARQLGVE